MRSLFISVLAVLVTGSCMDGSNQLAEPQLAKGESVVLEGRVTAIDSTPMFVDGDGLIFVQSEVYGDVTIHIPARERLCQARGLDAFSSISAGDNIKALGRATGSRALTVCVDEMHFLERLD